MRRQGVDPHEKRCRSRQHQAFDPAAGPQQRDEEPGRHKEDKRGNRDDHNLLTQRQNGSAIHPVLRVKHEGHHVDGAEASGNHRKGKQQKGGSRRPEKGPARCLTWESERQADTEIDKTQCNWQRHVGLPQGARQQQHCNRRGGQQR
jgi:hypothetical protein